MVDAVLSRGHGELEALAADAVQVAVKTGQEVHATG